LRPRCGPRFAISLKRSTLIFRYPQAGRPITPSLAPLSGAYRTSNAPDPSHPIYECAALARTVERVIGIGRQAVETDVAAIAAQLDLPLSRPMARLA